MRSELVKLNSSFLATST